MNRIKSGIKGLDELIGGGYLENSVILVSGKAGAGKTLFSTCFLYEGLKNGEAGIFVVTEQSPEELKKDIFLTFGWNLEEFEKKDLLRFIQVGPIFSIQQLESQKDIGNIVRLYIHDLLQKIAKEIQTIKAKRLVIDSITPIESFIRDEYLKRVGLISLIRGLKQLNLTALITSTIPFTKPNSLSISGIIEFLVDGIIKLDFDPTKEEFKRTLSILKLRGTKHSEYIHAFEIVKDGIKIVLSKMV